MYAAAPTQQHQHNPKQPASKQTWPSGAAGYCCHALHGCQAQHPSAPPCCSHLEQQPAVLSIGPMLSTAAAHERLADQLPIVVQRLAGVALRQRTLRQAPDNRTAHTAHTERRVMQGTWFRCSMLAGLSSWMLLHMPAQQSAVAVQLPATTNPAAGAWRVSYLMACCLMLVAGMPTASEPKPTSPSLTRPASRTKMRPASVTCGTHTHR